MFNNYKVSKYLKQNEYISDTVLRRFKKLSFVTGAPKYAEPAKYKSRRSMNYRADHI